ncbi:unnamed protein product [Choristocarpus tenellus]
MGCGGSKSLSKDDTVGLTSANGALDLRRGLVWIQEKNFEDKFEIVEVIGKGSIGEVSIVRRKQGLNGSKHRRDLSWNVDGGGKPLEYLPDGVGGGSVAESIGKQVGILCICCEESLVECVVGPLLVRCVWGLVQSRWLLSYLSCNRVLLYLIRMCWSFHSWFGRTICCSTPEAQITSA